MLFGFAIKERTIRLAGLTVLLACIAKAFLFDLANLETLYRIASFIGLGLILLAAACLAKRAAVRPTGATTPARNYSRARAPLAALATAVDALRTAVANDDRAAFRDLMERGQAYLEDRRSLHATRA